MVVRSASNYRVRSDSALSYRKLNAGAKTEEIHKELVSPPKHVSSEGGEKRNLPKGCSPSHAQNWRDVTEGTPDPEENQSSDMKKGIL